MRAINHERVVRAIPPRKEAVEGLCVGHNYYVCYLADRGAQGFSVRKLLDLRRTTRDQR